MLLKYFAFLLFAVTALIGCSKDDVEKPDPQETPELPVVLLRGIDWSNGTTALMHYNTDSTLKEIAYRFQNIVGSTVFTWQNKRLKDMADDRSMYKNTFYYDQSRISHYINSYKEVALPSSYKMEYSYNSNGTVATLKYYTTNEAGTTLKTSSVYTYNTKGELTKVVSQQANNIYTHIIEAYSDSTYFNPLMFVETGLSENYSVYNVPVLSKMKKYPAKIIRKVKLGNDDEFVDKIEENNCVIENRHIKKISTKITVPGMPGYENSIVATFKYQ